MKRVNYAGQTKYRLTVLDQYYEEGQARLICECACGALTTILAYNFKNGHTQSCGCLEKETRDGHIKHMTKHKEARRKQQSVEYRTWCEIKRRCFNENSQNYADYGGRGITMCSRWVGSFEMFLADVGRRPRGKYSIDRINNNGNYEPSNCRWATMKQQANNRRNNRALHQS